MGHWQVLALEVAELWSENAMDMIYQNQSNLVIKKVKDFTSTRIFLTVLLLLALGGAIRDKPCLLSAARLERLGSVVANLAIN
jgi:diacylglycerol kinase